MTVFTLHAETLRWDNVNPSGIIKHTVIWWVGGTSEEFTSDVLMPDLFFPVTAEAGFIKGEQYCFQVTASNIIGESARSVTLCHVVCLEVPSAPIDIVIE